MAALLLIGTTGLLTGCKQKVEPKIGVYKVEHYWQNIENDDYTKVSEETLRGKEGNKTSAKAKTYEGFTAQGFSQAAIRADGSTVVRINYNRNIITLKLKFDTNQETEPELEDGGDGIKLLKGKYAAPVLLKHKTKEMPVPIWPDEAPLTFPASSPDEPYNITWADGYKITIKGDERTKIDEPPHMIRSAGKTWLDIKDQLKDKVSLSSDWQGGDYEIYEWRLGDKTGEKLKPGYIINRHLTVYAVTNYAKFNIEGTKIKGYKGGRPKGKIIIPDSTTEIEKEAFFGCEGLTDVDFSGCTNLTQIGYSTFENCKNLKNVDFSSCTKLTKIDSRTFAECTSLTSIKLPANLTIIYQEAFLSCSKLTDINLPTKLTGIGYGAFQLCKDLKSINLPANLSFIAGHAFGGCENLTNLTVDPANKKYKAEGNVVYTKDGKTLVLAARSLTEVNILDTVTTIGERAFFGCKLLKSINLPANLTEIKKEAFYECTGLKGTIVFPAKLKTMEMTYSNDYGVFGSCTQLEGADFSACKELTTIPKKAFYGCTQLKTVNLPESLTQIDNYAFRDTALQSAVFADKTGWAVYNNWGFYDTDKIIIDETYLEDPATAAKYLRKTTGEGGYSDKFWKKKN